MNDDEIRAHYQSALSLRRVEQACPDPALLVAVAEQLATDAARMTILDHVAQCRDCKRELDMLLTVREASNTRQRKFPQTWAIAASVIAAAGIGTVLIQSQKKTDHAVDMLRGATSTATMQIDSLSTPVTLTWPNQTAVSYTVELLNIDGTSRYVATTTDTSLTLPDSLGFTSGRTYEWWVRARQLDGKEISLPFRRLTIIAP